MSEHKLFKVSSSQLIDITPMITGLSWSSDVAQMAVKLDFSIINHDTAFLPMNPVGVEDIVLLRNDIEDLFLGKIITESKNGRNPASYSALDFSFYLTANKEIYQFEGMGASQAITKILNDFAIPIGSVASMTTVISKIYTSQSLAEIIKDILTQVEQETGVKYRMEMRAGKIYIEPQSDLIVNATFQLAENLGAYNVADIVIESSSSKSIENMRNSIKVISADTTAAITIAEVQNPESIGIYGKLQEIVSVSQKDIAKARNIANQVLADLGRVAEEGSVKLFGHDSARAGRLITVTEPLTALSGQYLISGCTHNVENGIHLMNLNLKRK